MPKHVLDDVLLPVMTLRESALESNAAVMQAYVERHGLLFAPHMKTHMAPALARRQTDLGAWGVTVASVQQAVAAWDHGFHRILVANEVLDPAGLAWIARRRELDAGADVLFQVDSAAGVAAAADHGPLPVLVEIGFPGGRTGVRSPADGVALARAARSAGLEVRGVTGYEGGLPGPDEAREYVRGVLAATAAVRPLVTATRTLLSMGGSAWFDAVVDAVADRPDDVDVLLRSGASLTHDDGFYAERTPFARHPEEGRLEAAIRVWGRVTSAPEPGLALVAVGKRDISFDEGLPVVREVRPGGTARARPVTPVPGSVTVTRLDDQHCYLRTTPDAPAVAPGDVVVFGVSHPCTVFDKWREVLVLADDDTVLDTIETVFR
ncbi:D-serine deaminase-like pyridoxal phosphate-dependent protein [Curtobacterium luteum]|uniref:D-serine deaminase-like pyridoxal phosphate-dependent protein n=1 Tax=Curtobacterium luteum TaxID=33881 RepID=A0ABS2RTH5_9MICO|nr:MULTISPECIES: alanine racemase [Curtobacterium]MBM7802305.1 D-serine deaminase-like pyridoxal phosphate-dependent protein [Curtobacterium luteum]NUU52409.1 alanine racemase [Curtobacterium luteum]